MSADIRLHISQEKFEELELDDLIALEDAGSGQIKLRDMKRVLAQFVVDEHGQALAAAEAQAAIGKVKAKDLRAMFEQFGEGIRGLKESAVPPRQP
jgi:hypothetical protein